VDATPNLDSIRNEIRLVEADIADFDRLEAEIREAAPQEVYNVASISFGPDAWADPVQTGRVGALAVGALLEAVRGSTPNARVFQASTAWVFGRPEESPQNESTPYAPVEPYGAAKAHADFLIRAYRERHGIFACSGILYNHESPRRPPRFVTRKITRAAAAIKLGMEQEVVLGDVDATRDWGYAKDVVEAAWLMLQAERPADYVIATGESHTVRELAEIAFASLGLDWHDHVRVDAALARGRAEVANLVGDASAARERLGWAPSLTFEELVKLLVAEDVRAARGQ
jgi:GDPmannose 4,6-dehydratase